MTYTSMPIYALTLTLTLCALGCAEPDEGEVTVRVYGEEFIEDGIPSEAMADGWSVRFEVFTVKVDDVLIAQTTLPDASAINLANASEGTGHLYSSVRVPVGEHTSSAYTLSAIEVRGVASKGDLTKRMDWLIDTTTRYTGCETTTAVDQDEPGTFQITVHADHLFYDSLVSEDPDVRFQALADADTDSDGTITRAELEATGIGAYDPGSANEIDNLWSWLEAQSSTLGHVDGEGHCDFSLIQEQ